MVLLVLILGIIDLGLLAHIEIKKKKLYMNTINLINTCSFLNKELIKKMSTINLILYNPDILESEKIKKIEEIIHKSDTATCK
jgi:hypothetical protein